MSFRYRHFSNFWFRPNARTTFKYRPYAFAFPTRGLHVLAASVAVGVSRDPPADEVSAASHISGAVLGDDLKRELSGVKVSSCIARAIFLIAAFTPWALILLLALITRRKRLFTMSYRMLRRTFAICGPTFLKLGQWVSTRPDVFPSELCTIMRRLTSQAPSHPFSHTKTRIQESFGVSSIDEVFAEVDPKPISSGSVGQIHLARLRHPDAQLAADLKEDAAANLPLHIQVGRSFIALGNRSLGAALRVLHHIPMLEVFMPAFHTPVWSDTPFQRIAAAGPPPRPAREREKDRVFHPDVVVVKVLHPGIERTFQRDLSILTRCAEFVLRHAPTSLGLEWMGVDTAVAEFARFLLSQVDLRTEAAHLRTFRANFLEVDHVHIPPPVAPYVGRSVLVMRYFDNGCPVLPFVTREDERVQRQVAQLGLHSFLKMLFVDNFIHCDLHPGNLLIKRAGTRVGLDGRPLPARFQMPDAAPAKSVAAAPVPDADAPVPDVDAPVGEGPRAAPVASAATLTAEHCRFTRWWERVHVNVRERLAARRARRVVCDECGVRGGHADECSHHVVQGPRAVQPVEICFVDAGLVTSLTPRDWQNFLSLFATVAAGDGREGARLMLQESRRQACPDPRKFEEDMQGLYEAIGLAPVSALQEMRSFRRGDDLEIEAPEERWMRERREALHRLREQQSLLPMLPGDHGPLESPLSADRQAEEQERRREDEYRWQARHATPVDTKATSGDVGADEGAVAPKSMLKSFTLGDIEVGATVEKILNMVRDHKVAVEANFTAMVLAIICIEGLGRTLDPDTNLVAASIPYMLGNMPRQVTHLAPTLAKRFPDLVPAAAWAVLPVHPQMHWRTAVENFYL
eukprot:TRINITY_DN55821_c0_g1_i1.p1 TRINITY_DN55821_c0_g1~~TRINITY_DN55821_c0_g1_i1.p1  ORF type:complete len:858 (-),score=139.20 TRINITY_DN55821_c0_g1_i1:660-3233(-)